MLPLRVLATLALVHPTWATASTIDLEDRSSEIDEQDKKLVLKASFESEYHEFDNLDFRALDESSDQAILDSDDRGRFVYSGVSLELGYQIDPELRFVLGSSYRGLWGNDQIGGTSQFGGWLYFTGMYVEYAPTIGSIKPTFRVGRQHFDLGGIPGREYILADIVDMVRIDIPVSVGRLVLIPVNVVGLSGDNDDVTFVSYVGQNSDLTRGFRGDTVTTRYGGMLVLDELPLPIDFRMYGFYTDIGALGSGSDIVYGGDLGNFADNDWVANYGARISAKVGPLTPWAHIDGSMGIDRKEVVAQDVNANGFAWGAGLQIDSGGDDLGISGEVSYFESQGPVYADNGLQYSHGYVGMKGRHSGGLLANRFLGWHPTSYVGMFGVDTSPHDIDRKSGTRVLSASTEARLPRGTHIGLGYWWFGDTGLTSLNIDEVEFIEPPFGYSRAEFEAEERLGRELGHELNADAGIWLTPNLDVFVQGGVFLPGSFYGIEVARVAGTSLGSSDPAMLWDLSLGTRVTF
jgi:hypothetical protein